MTQKPALETTSILFAYSAAGVFWGAFAAAAPSFKAVSQLDTAGFGLLLLAMSSGAVPAMVIFGSVADRIARWALPCCLLAFAFAAAALSSANGLTGLVVAFFCVGAASGALDIALNLRVSAIETANSVRLFNKAHAMFPLALLVASPLVGLARANGAEIGIIFAFVAVVLGAASLLEGAASKSATFSQSSNTMDTQPRVNVSGLVLLLGFIAALGAFQEMAVQSWGAIFVETALGTSATIGGIAPAAFMMGLSGGRFAAHILEQRFEPMLLIAVAATIGVPAFILVAVSQTWELALIGFVLSGIAVGPVEPTVFRAVTQRGSGGSQGRMLNVVTTIAYVGYLTSPPVLGSVAETSGWPALWVLAAGFAALVAGMSVLIRRKL